jgi:hypothetical protein
VLTPALTTGAVVGGITEPLFSIALAHVAATTTSWVAMGVSSVRITMTEVVGV